MNEKLKLLGQPLCFPSIEWHIDIDAIYGQKDLNERELNLLKDFFDGLNEMPKDKTLKNRRDIFIEWSEIVLSEPLMERVFCRGPKFWENIDILFSAYHEIYKDILQEYVSIEYRWPMFDFIDRGTHAVLLERFWYFWNIFAREHLVGLEYQWEQEKVIREIFPNIRKLKSEKDDGKLVKESLFMYVRNAFAHEEEMGKRQQTPPILLLAVQQLRHWYVGVRYGSKAQKYIKIPDEKQSLEDHNKMSQDMIYNNLLGETANCFLTLKGMDEFYKYADIVQWVQT